MLINRAQFFYSIHNGKSHYSNDSPPNEHDIYVYHSTHNLF
jgi:hypothetical protein